MITTRRRDLHRTLARSVCRWVLAALAGCTFACAAPAAEPERPNVLFIIGDDIAWTDYSFMGHADIDTPSLDRLAREGVVFRRGYVPTALCRPSLATIITGLYPHQHGITGNDPAIPADVPRQRTAQDPEYQALRERLIAKIDRVPTLPRVLAQHGYASLQTGKWWEGPYARGGFTHGMTHGDPARGGRHGDAGLAIGREGLAPVRRFLDEGREGKPFFIWYAPFLPHTPHNPPERLLAKYRTEDRPIELARYYAMCEWFDETCGDLLALLDDRGLRDNTLVVYLADNGWIQRTGQTEVPGNWNQSFAPRSKQSPNEGGVRTPILLRWPSKLQPGESDALASSIDLAPTILSACGIEPPPDLPGIDLVESYRTGDWTRTAIFGEGFAHDVANVDRPAASLLFRWCIEAGRNGNPSYGRWKLIVPHEGQVGRYAAVHKLHLDAGVQLYDLESDPHENRNMAEARPDTTRRLRQLIDQWWAPQHDGPGSPAGPP